MSVSLCIHGHFYQPPREDPWLGLIPAEPSAAVMRNWNERITRESYAPLAWARRLDDEGRIVNLVNCYEWTSFNVGPTLLRWMRYACPDVLARMVEADKKSRERWGHGNAIAQVYHHVIMPLASQEDRDLEASWAIDDFYHHFGRRPEGMWLSECAADIPSLETLAGHGIRFVILAPRQAKAVIRGGVSTPVNEATLTTGEPYKIALPSGRSMTVVFYDGPLSQSIAFEGLLRNGENFWRRIEGAAAALRSSGQDAPLLTIATDGETYGHHFTFGEMALAYVLEQGALGRDGICLTNLAAYIAANPPIHEVTLHEPSSWSCVHGVERWRSDCGCSDGGHGGWNQQWRKPLRDALDLARSAVTGHYEAAGGGCFTDARAALKDYGRVLAEPSLSGEYAARWFKGDAAHHDRAWKLLAMQEHSLASFASCAWFFDDLARIEPVNAMTFALRSLDLMRETGGPDMEGAFAEALAKGASNQASAGSGKDIFYASVLPRRDDEATLCLLAWLVTQSQNRLPGQTERIVQEWPELSVELTPDSPLTKGEQSGSAIIRLRRESGGTRWRWNIQAPGLDRTAGQEFRLLSEASIIVTAAEGGKSLSRSVSEFSRPMTEALLSTCLENWERRIRPEMQAIAAHAASLTLPWVEAQHDVVRPDFWVGFVPYLALESMVNDKITPAQRRQIQVVLSLHLSSRAKTLARSLLSESMLRALRLGMQNPGATPGAGQQSTDDERLAVWAQRARCVLPDMDWWEVQNKIWDIGVERFPALARELGYR